MTFRSLVLPFALAVSAKPVLDPVVVLVVDACPPIDGLVNVLKAESSATTVWYSRLGMAPRTSASLLPTVTVSLALLSLTAKVTDVRIRILEDDDCGGHKHNNEQTVAHPPLARHERALEWWV
jgi:hypothetical protein